ncbi:DUF1667 domain-containing protein [Treponema sp. OMZ 792]|uniref:DUF1667 domain-containing protein n=1 Tax=unclassified Treponema TaxID=2638727 RepID=UPI0020A2A970|nr:MULTISPECIES: DUF1667 domain-containing protein [unclassified Treponema]UTC74581.1 DUF1667 domain-containing protein [Treponema sp. OMZ 792]UTC80977.1 DUF1667 domain-containing protein [Treponema sp. OMZ 798]
MSRELIKKDFTCVSCPRGCKLSVFKEESGEFSVKGNLCKGGELYAMQEIKNPRRNISSTVIIEGGVLPSLPVKTSSPIPKALIFDVMKEINRVKTQAPKKMGEVIIENVLNTGVDITASRSCLKADPK